MAGRAAAPLPRSARSQPPALRAPLSPLLSPALGGGGSSLLGSLAPVIRGAGLGGRSPRPPPPPRHPGWGAPREPRAQTPPHPAPQAQAQGRGPGPHDPYQGSPSERRGVPATHRLPACGRAQACAIRVLRARPARTKGAPGLPSLVTWGHGFVLPSDSVYHLGGGA